MKAIFGLFLVFLLLPMALAIDVDVEKVSSKEVMIIGLDQPSHFSIDVTNNAQDDYFSFYTFFGLGIEPRDEILIKQDEKKRIDLQVFPREDSKLRGYSTFSYFIQGKDSSEIEEKFTINLIDLEDAFEIGSSTIDPESNIMKIYIHNKVNFNFSELNVKFNSAFFDIVETMSLGPNEKKEFEVNLDKEEFNKLMAGYYTLNAKITTEDIQAKVEGKIEFVEKDILETTEKNYGLVIFNKVIQKENQGNTVVDSTTVMKKNIISRAFTNFNIQPSEIERDGAIVYYTWHSQINPGERFEVIAKTNWLIPFIIILLIIAIVVLAKKYSDTDLVLRKKVSFVKAKGGEFALKVTIIVEAKRFVENIKILDKIPALAKVYERFPNEIPTKFDKSKNKIQWDFDHLEQGERRVLTYVIYSKVGVLGKFALPSTIALFEKEGKTKEASSNVAYFLAQQK